MPDKGVAIALAPDYLSPIEVTSDCNDSRHVEELGFEPAVLGPCGRSNSAEIQIAAAAHRTHPPVCGRNVVPQHCARKPFFTLTALKSGDFHEAQDKSLKPANALLSLKLRLELSTVVRICVEDPTLRCETLFHGSGTETCVLPAFWPESILRWPSVPGKRGQRLHRADPDTPVSPNSLVHRGSSVHGSPFVSNAARRGISALNTGRSSRLRCPHNYGRMHSTIAEGLRLAMETFDQRW